MKTQERALDYCDSRLVSIRKGIGELMSSPPENDPTDLSQDRKDLIQAAYQIINIAVGTAKSGKPINIIYIIHKLRVFHKVNAENPELVNPRRKRSKKTNNEKQALDRSDPRLVSIRHGISHLIASLKENDADLSGSRTPRRDRKELIEAASQIIEVAVGIAGSGNPIHVSYTVGLLRVLPQVNAANPGLAEPDENWFANMDSFPSH
jgi:hypothetical protein